MGGSLSTDTPSECGSCGRHSDVGIRKTGVTGVGDLTSALSMPTSGRKGHGWEKRWWLGRDSPFLWGD